MTLPVHRSLADAADPRGPTSLPRIVSGTAAWLFDRCGKGSIATYFRAVEIAYRFMDSYSWYGDEHDVFIVALVIASKIENEMELPYRDVHRMWRVRDAIYFHRLEVKMLDTLGFHVAFPTAYQFLLLVLEESNLDAEMRAEATGVLTRASFVPGVYMSVDPSPLACAAVAIAAPMRRMAFPNSAASVRRAVAMCACSCSSRSAAAAEAAKRPPRDDVWSVYDRHVRIGRGSYGAVFTATERSSGKLFAVKRASIPDADFVSHGVKESVLRELSITRMLPRHENINEFVTFFMSLNHETLRVHSVMALAECDLYALLKKKGPLPEREVRSITAQIANGLHFVHSHGIAHGDVKTHNILVFGDCVKISDFGTASFYGHGLDLSGECTVHTRSPESLLGLSVRSWPVDMWALGCVTAEIAVGGILMWMNGEAELDVWRNIVAVLGTPSEHEWPDITKTKRWRVVREESQGIPAADLHRDAPKISVEHAEFIGRLLVYNPDRRMSALETLSHPFLA